MLFLSAGESSRLVAKAPETADWRALPLALRRDVGTVKRLITPNVLGGIQPFGTREATAHTARPLVVAIGHDLGNFLRRLALPKSVAHARYVTFQMAEVAIPRRLFKVILRRISRLGPLAPVPTWPGRCSQEWQRLETRRRGLLEYARAARPGACDGVLQAVKGRKEKP